MPLPLAIISQNMCSIEGWQKTNIGLTIRCPQIVILYLAEGYRTVIGAITNVFTKRNPKSAAKRTPNILRKPFGSYFRTDDEVQCYTIRPRKKILESHATIE